MAEPGAVIDRKAILTLRQRVRFQDGRPYDARYSKVAAALEAQFGWKRRFGRLRLLDARVCWQHCGNQLADGHILDATTCRVWRQRAIQIQESLAFLSTNDHSSSNSKVVDVGSSGSGASSVAHKGGS